MPDSNLPLSGVHAAIAELLSAAERAEPVWTVPRAPGKWSPSQTVEHVARIMEESANVVAGVPSKFPNVPFFLRPLVRARMFNRILKRQAFFEMKGSRAFTPASGPDTPADARVRLNGALARFDQACRARGATGQDVASSLFGRVPVADFVRFQELHVRHHLQQMPGPEAAGAPPRTS
jgi:hypothetical protein